MSSKAAKKNQKRREKKKDEKLTHLVEERKREEQQQEQLVKERIDPVDALKAQLAEAKASGDNKLAAKLRQDLWVFQDANSGVSLNTEQEEVKESIDRISTGNLLPTTHAKPTSDATNTSPMLTTSAASPPPPSTITPLERDIKKIKKKLEQVEKLKKMKSEGVELQESQITKVAKEEEFRKEIADLEAMLTSTQVVK